MSEQAAIRTTSLPNRNRPVVLVWLGMVVFVLAWTGLIIAAPVLESTGHTSLAASIYLAFRPICHQLPDRSFHLFGEQFAVCARCTGIYFGFAAGVILYPLLRSLHDYTTPPRIWLLLSPVPTGIDFALGFFGIWENTHWSRFLTAALFGVVAAIYVVPGVQDVAQMVRESLQRRKPGHLPAAPIVVIISGGGKLSPSDYSAPERRI
jgi:uncharacterized membrane protein